MRGDRVADETLPLEYISNAYEEVGGEGFAVFDNATREEMINEGLVRGYFGMVTPGTKFSNFDELFARGEKDGFCFKAATLEELAAKTGMDPQRLTATASRMNELVKLGKDEDFYKDAQWLREVKTGPSMPLKAVFVCMPRRAVQVLMKTFSRSMLMASRSEASMPLVRMQGDSIPTHTICTLLKAQLHRGPLTAGKLAVEHFVKTRK